MSNKSDSVLSRTSKGSVAPAMLVLEDGLSFKGRACGAKGERTGEICFNTSLEGYLEVITDPSYAGQIVVCTYPQIGNYGVALEDVQSKEPAMRALVVRDMNKRPSNWRSDMSLGEYLIDKGIVAIEGVDTREIVRHIRDCGAMRAIVSTEDLDEESLLRKVRSSEPLVGNNLVSSVSPTSTAAFVSQEGLHGFALEDASPETLKVIAYDCGVKSSILEGLHREGISIITVPYDTPHEEVLAMEPDGVFLSNGPGDPDAVEATYEQVRHLLGKIPIFGICLGHQMISKAAGAEMEKLKYGHRGGNQPVMNLMTGQVEITAQNHGFGLRFDSLGELIPELSGGQSEHVDDLRHWAKMRVAPVVDNDRYGRIRLTHVNLNDGTPEGIAFLDIPAFSVQYHPEANPGPTDSHYLFTAFTNLMNGDDDYLNINTSKDRLSGWKF